MRLGELSEAQGLALVDYLLAVERRRRGELRAPRSSIPSPSLARAWLLHEGQATPTDHARRYRVQVRLSDR